MSTSQRYFVKKIYISIQQYNIPADWTYSVSPVHSGIYPVSEALYDNWKLVYGVKVSSTLIYKREGGPNGFIYKNISVSILLWHAMEWPIY